MQMLAMFFTLAIAVYCFYAFVHALRTRYLFLFEAARDENPDERGGEEGGTAGESEGDGGACGDG